MAERVARPTEATSCNWADGGTYPSTDPGTPARQAGFKPKDYPVAGAGAIIPAEDTNFLHRLEMEMLSWLRDSVPREWADISEGITATTTVSRLFRVFPPTAGMYSLGQQVFSVTGTATGGGNVTSVCTDGEQIYYVSGTTGGYVVIADPEDGSEIAECAASGGNFSAICTDGAYIYATTDAAGTAGLRRLSRTDGTEDDNVGSEYDCARLVTNGEYAVGVGMNSDAGGVVVYSGIQGTMAEDGTVATGSAGIVASAIDHENVYVGGAQSTFDVWAIVLSTRGWAWRVTLPCSGTPGINSIDTDGEFVYVATSRTALSAGGNANLFVLNRLTGATIYTMDIPDSSVSATNLSKVVVDDRYIYVTEAGTADLQIYHKGVAPENAWAGNVQDVSVYCADGVSVIGRDTSATTDLCRYRVGGPTKTFMRAASDDPTRQPFHTLAVPVR